MTLEVRATGAGAVADGGRVVRSLRPSRVEPEFWDRPDLARPLAERDVAVLFRALQEVGLSQRTIARLTAQSQSEISEVIAGRRIRMIHVLERIADGLGIPRKRMGLADAAIQDTVEPASDCSSIAPDETMPGTPPRRVSALVATAKLPPIQRTTKTVFRWTGAEIRMLREAMRMSVREFAAHLGVSDRMVSKWEAGGDGITPRPVNQAALDTCLARASAGAQARFAAWPTRTRNHGALLEARRWVMHVVLDVPTLDAALGVAERVLAAADQVPELVANETMVSPEERPFHRYRVHL